MASNDPHGWAPSNSRDHHLGPAGPSGVGWWTPGSTVRCWALRMDPGVRRDGDAGCNPNDIHTPKAPTFTRPYRPDGEPGAHERVDPMRVVPASPGVVSRGNLRLSGPVS